MERFAADPDFQVAWRGFARACAHQLPSPPPDARAWIATADEYDAGRLSAEQLTTARERRAGTFAALFETATVSERAALSAAAHRLWPKLDPDGWHETAWYFLNWCATAGIREPALVQMLRESFGPFLAARGVTLRELAQEVEPGAPPDPAVNPPAGE